MERKRSARAMFILLILTLYGTFDISLQWWLLILSKSLLPSYWKTGLSLIIYLAIIITFYHQVLLHEKNRNHYILAASQWLWKYICKSSIRSLGPLALLQVTCWNTVWIYMLSCHNTLSESLLIRFQILLNMVTWD